MFRVSRGNVIDDAETIDGAREIIRGQEPDRDHMDVISRDPLPTGHTSRRWGAGIKFPESHATLIRRSRCQTTLIKVWWNTKGSL
jgi:hypothetical protein